MKRRTIFLIFTLSSSGIFFNACEQEPAVIYPNLPYYLDALKSVRFGCRERIENFYFTGYINGKKVCYYNGYDLYEARTDRWSQTVTEGPTLNPNVPPLSSGRFISIGVMPKFIGRDRHLMDYIEIETPVFSSDSTWSAIARHSIKLGTLPLQSNQIGNREGFNVALIIPYYGPYDPLVTTGISATLGTSFGNQDNSRLEIIEIEQYEEFGWEYYHIVMEIECNLYHGGYVESGTFYGRLTEGRLVMVVGVPQG